MAANLVTLVRLVIAVAVAATAGGGAAERMAWLAVAGTVLFATLDGVDGWLARRTGPTAFGAWFDMETDALFILILSALVWRFEKAGAWVLACGLMRYAFVASRWAWPWMGGPLSPTRRGKTVAVLQFVGLGLALLPVIRPPASTVIAAVTLALLAWSFAVDVGRLRAAKDAKI